MNQYYPNFYIFKTFHFLCKPINVLSLLCFQIFMINVSDLLQVMITCNNLFKGIAKTLKNLCMFSISCFSKQFQQVLLLLASKHSLYLPYLMRMLPLIKISLMIYYANCLNGFYVILYLMIMDLSASFITVISIKIYPARKIML